MCLCLSEGYKTGVTIGVIQLMLNIVEVRVWRTSMFTCFPWDLVVWWCQLAGLFRLSSRRRKRKRAIIAIIFHLVLSSPCQCFSALISLFCSLNFSHTCRVEFPYRLSAAATRCKHRAARSIQSRSTERLCRWKLWSTTTIPSNNYKRRRTQSESLHSQCSQSMAWKKTVFYFWNVPTVW